MLLKGGERYFLRMNGSSRGSILNARYKTLHQSKAGRLKWVRKQAKSTSQQNKCPQRCILLSLCLNSLTGRSGTQRQPSLSHYYSNSKSCTKMRNLPGDNLALVRGLWCTIMSCKWGNFIEFYRLSGIYFPQYCSCRWCICGSLFSDGGWNLPVWLLSLLLFSWITGQVRDKLWAKCQFPFHLHCMLFFLQKWWLSCYVRYTNTPKQKTKHLFLSLFSLTAFSWLNAA